MRAKLWLLSSVLVLGLAACGDDVDETAEEVPVVPPAVEEPAVATPGVVEPEPTVPVVPAEEPDLAAPPAGVIEPETEEPEVAGPQGTTTFGGTTATEGTVTTFGGEPGPTVTEGGGTAETTDPVMDRPNTEDEAATLPAAGTTPPAGNQ